MKPGLLLLSMTTCITACSQQNWYQAAQSANTANCMKEPLSEYENCNKPSNESYLNYQADKEQLENK